MGCVLRRWRHSGAGNGWHLGEGVQFGLSLLVWGVFVRTVIVWHITWSVNSVTHMWGYQTYATGEGSRNNVLIGLISNGEGWHNNHHADPRSARHGHKWWEFDVTYLSLKGWNWSGSPARSLSRRICGIGLPHRKLGPEKTPKLSGPQCGAIRLLPQFMVIERSGTRFAARHWSPACERDISS